MTLRTALGRAIAGLLFCTISSAQGAQGDSLVLDTTTGNYILTYLGEDYDTGAKQMRRIIIVPATKIVPIVQSNFGRTGVHSVTYRYTVKNKSASLQALAGFFTNASQVPETSQVTPTGWFGSVSPIYGETSVRLGWHARAQQAGDGLKPGYSQPGFAIESGDLPGIGIMRLFGATPIRAFPDEGPDQPLADELDALLRPDNDSVPRLAAVPRISVPTPYDAATVLANIQKHLDTDLVGMKLVDPALVAKMDPWFATAIDAAKRNNTVALRNALQELRRLLKQECADVDQEGNETETDDKPVAPARIAKLAARVLNFDLKYVGSRI